MNHRPRISATLDQSDLTVEIHNWISGVTFRNLFADILLEDLFRCEVACEFVAANVEDAVVKVKFQLVYKRSYPVRGGMFIDRERMGPPHSVRSAMFGCSLKDVGLLNDIALLTE